MQIIYIGETGRRLGDVSANAYETLKEMTRTHPNQSPDISISLIILVNIIMTICGLSLHQGNTESRKDREQKFIFQIGTLNPHGITNAFHSTNLFLFITLPCSHQ